MKLIIVGEHPSNHSGFSQLTHNISEILNKEFREKVAEIITVGYGRGNKQDAPANYKIITTGVPGIIGSIQGLMLAEDRKCGMHTLRMLLRTAREPCTILTIGDPCTFWYMKTTKLLFPGITWISYIPVESTELVSVATFSFPGRTIITDIARLYSYADKIIAYTENGMNVIRDMLDVENCKSFIYHGIDNEKFRSAKIKEFKLLKDKFVVGSVCRNGYRKALDIMMIGFSRFLSGLKSTQKPEPLLLLHTPRQDTMGWNLMSLAKKLKIQDNFLISDLLVESFAKKRDQHGKPIVSIKEGASLDDLASLYKSMDCYINMSRGEGFGIPVIEAMSLGVPVVYIDHANLGEICKNRGFPVKVGGYEYKEGYEVIHAIANPESIAANLDHVYRAVNGGDRTHLDMMTNNAKKFVESIDWHSENIISSWIDETKTILENKEIPPQKPRRVIAVSTYDVGCGIATYTENLLDNLKRIDKNTEYMVIDDTTDIDKYIDLILSSGMPTIVHIQYEPNIYKSETLVSFISKLKSLSKGTVKIVITMHKEDARSVKTLDGLVDTVILHADNNNVANSTKYSNVLVMPHPFYSGTEIMKNEAREKVREELGLKPDQTVIGTAGFMLPYKQIDRVSKEIIKLMADKEKDDNYALFLPVAIHSKDAVGYAKNTIDEIIRFAEEQGVSDRVVMKLGFHKQEDLMKYLQCLDVGYMFVNSPNVGANSGSVRMLISCGVPCIIPSKGLMHRDLYSTRTTFNVAASGSPEEFIRSGLDFIKEHPDMVKSMRGNCIAAKTKNNFATFASTHITKAYARLFSSMQTVQQPQEVANGPRPKQVDAKIQGQGGSSDRSDELRGETGTGSGEDPGMRRRLRDNPDTAPGA
jgi:glycosyltransferase involved in cell wall biosynthesis